jgi:hypothetical protein
MKLVNPNTAGKSTFGMTAAPFVPVGEAPDPVVEPVPVAVDCTLVLPEAQKNAPLMTLLLASAWNGSQLMFPELCMLKVPLQSVREGRATLLEISLVYEMGETSYELTLRNFQTY